MISEVFEFLEWLNAAFAGWRFLVSPRYRRSVYERWRVATRWRIAWDVICGSVGVIFSILIFVTMIFIIPSFFG